MSVSRTLLIVLFTLAQFINGENEQQMDVVFESLLAEVPIGQSRTFNFTLKNTKPPMNVTNEQIYVKSYSSAIAQVSTFSVEKVNDEIWSGQFTIIPNNIGNAHIHISIVMKNESEIHKLPDSMEIVVTRNRFIHLDEQNQFFFNWFMYFAILFTNVILGTVMDLKKIKTFFKMPKAIIISFVFTLLVPLVSILSFNKINFININCHRLSKSIKCNIQMLICLRNNFFLLIIQSLVS